MPTKNVALKLDEGVYAQVAVLAGLESTDERHVSIPDVIRKAVDDHLAAKRVELADRATEALAAIERRAAEQRAQIEALFGNGQEPDQPSRGGSRRREATNE